MDEANGHLSDILAIKSLVASLEYAEARVVSKNFDTAEDNGDARSEQDNALVERRWKTLSVISTQQQLIGLKLEMSKKRQWYQRIYNVQQSITYLYYAVFVLNAFLTGFGLTGETGGGDVETDTATTTTA